MWQSRDELGWADPRQSSDVASPPSSLVLNNVAIILHLEGSKVSTAAARAASLSCSPTAGVHHCEVLVGAPNSPAVSG